MTVPPHGTGPSPVVPPHGAMSLVFGPSPVPPGGHLLHLCHLLQQAEGMEGLFSGFKASKTKAAPSGYPQGAEVRG